MAELNLIWSLYRRIRHLESRITSVTIPVQNSINTYDSVAALRLETTQYGLVWIKTGSPYYWDPTSTDADDGASVIKLDAYTTGRYRQLSI